MIFDEIDRLKAELDELRPLPPDAMRKLNEKLRLDWNYHSNALEGNTLTYGETKALLLHDRYIGNKEGRHYREIRAHDDVIQSLDELVKNEEQNPLSEKLIKELHGQMLGEPYWTPALTPDGQETQKKVIPGQYKTQPNSVMRSTGDMFFYADPVEVPGRMGELLDEYRKLNSDPDVHPVQLATWFHYDFIRIHPFDDGNGRLARILMNLILMRRGLVPAIIPVEAKPDYLDALQLVDATDDLEPFLQVVSKHVQRIIKLEIKAARGENIDEPGDLRKKIKLISSRLPNERNARPHKDWEVVKSFWESQILPFCQVFDRQLDSFLEVVMSANASYKATFLDTRYYIANDPGHLNAVLNEKKAPWQSWQTLEVSTELAGIDRKGGEEFSFKTSFDILFNDYEVIFFPSYDSLVFSLAYDELQDDDWLASKAESCLLIYAKILEEEIQYYFPN